MIYFKNKYLVLFVWLFSVWSVSSQSTMNPDALLIKGDSLFVKGALSEAYKTYDLADSIFTNKEDWEKVCTCKYGLIYTQLKLGEAASVVEGIDESLKMCKQKIEGAHLSIGKLMYLDGILENHLRNAEYTDVKALEAIEYLTPIVGEQDITIANLNNLLGICFYNRKDYYKALDYYNKSIEIKTIVNGANHHSLGTTLNNIGIIHQLLGEGEKAIEFYEKSLKIKIKKYGHNHMKISNTKFNIAQQYKNIGLYKKALSYLIEVIEIDKNQEELVDFKMAHRLSTLSELYLAVGKPDLAVTTGEKSIAYYKKTKLNPVYPATGYQSLGSIYRQLGQFDNAVKNYQSSLYVLTGEKINNLFDNPTIDAWNVSERIYQTLFKKAGTLKEWYDDTDEAKYLVQSLVSYEKVIDVMSQIQMNVETLNSNYSLLEDSRFIFEEALHICYQLFNLTKEEQYIDRAFNIDNLSKSFLLRKSLKTSMMQGLASVPDSILKQMRNIKNDIINARLLANTVSDNKINQLKIAYNKLEQSVIKRYPSYSMLRHENTFDIQSIQEGLFKTNETILSWFIGEENGFGLTLDQEQKTMSKFIVDKDLDQNIKEFSTLVSNYTTAVSKSNSSSVFQNFVRLSHSISTTILPPNLVLGEELVFIPDGALNLIPLDLLLKAKPLDEEKVDYSQLAYLIKDHSVRYATSWLDVKSSETSRSIDQILAVAPSYEGPQTQLLASRSGFSDLSFTIKEVEEIATIFKTKILQGKSALKTEFLNALQGNNLIHLAMHAFSDDVDPDMSGLVFANPSNKGTIDTNQILYGHEIADLDLSAELVVLSACNTGTGKIISGEGSLSLARAFKQAGCSNVIMSLWQADDESTSLIMTDFYKGLKAGKGKADALRFAKLDYLANNRKQFPYFWSTFILSGDNQVVAFEARNYLLYGVLGLFIAALLGFFMVRNSRIKSAL